MIESITRMAVEEGHLGELSPLITRMRQDGLPAFVVRSVSPDADTAIKLCEAEFLPHGFKRVPFHTRPLTWEVPDPRYPSLGDQGLHLDQEVEVEETVNTVSVYTVALGEVIAGFLPVVEGINPAKAKKMIKTHTNIITEGEDSITGEVDNSIFVPTYYFAKLCPGDVLPFRLKGHIPLSHDIKSLVRPRRSHAIDLFIPSNRQS